jgi:hypothetical protein
MWLWTVSLVSLAPVRNFSAVSLTPVKLSKTKKASLTGVVDMGEEFLIIVNDTGKACFAGVNDTGEAPNFLHFSKKIRKNLKSFLGMPIGTRRSSLTKKTRGEISHGTVPLNEGCNKSISRTQFMWRALYCLMS